MSNGRNSVSFNKDGRLDHARVFHLYAFFGGDTKRAACAAQCEERYVVALAHDFNWKDQIKGWNRLDTPEGLAAEQEANRAANYLIAKKMHDMYIAIIEEASQNPEIWAGVQGIKVDKNGNKTFEPKVLTELSKAMQIVQDMTYRALGDKIPTKVAETTQTNPSGDPTSLAINIYAGLQAMADGAKRSDHVLDVTATPVQVDEASLSKNRTPN